MLTKKTLPVCSFLRVRWSWAKLAVNKGQTSVQVVKMKLSTTTLPRKVVESKRLPSWSTKTKAGALVFGVAEVVGTSRGTPGTWA